MKKLLLITEGFYNYDFEIQKELSNKGYSVKLFQANIEMSYFEKVFYRKKIESYYNNKKYKAQSCLLEESDFDIVLVIGGHSLSVDVLKKLRNRQKKAIFILYLWDNIARVDNYEKIKSYFDRIITFDRIDAIKYHLWFRPLFYVEDYEFNNHTKIYDMSFFGWLHSERALIVKNIIDKYFETKHTYVYLVTGYYTYIVQKLSEIIKHGERISHFLHIKRLNSKEVANILLRSRHTIDIHHETQNGLTMRTIESLASRTKIWTTNRDVVYYDFYDENNIRIIDRNCPIVDNVFLNTEWKDIDPAIVKRYSISEWVKDILSDSIKYDFMKHGKTES